MKKILLLISLLIISAQAVSWSQLKSWNKKDVEPDAQYNLETEGYNVRVYEFTPLSDPGSTCVMTFTNEKMGMFCFAKSKDAIRKDVKK